MTAFRVRSPITPTIFQVVNFIFFVQNVIYLVCNSTIRGYPGPLMNLWLKYLVSIITFLSVANSIICSPLSLLRFLFTVFSNCRPVNLFLSNFGIKVSQYYFYVVCRQLLKNLPQKAVKLCTFTKAIFLPLPLNLIQHILSDTASNFSTCNFIFGSTMNPVPNFPFSALLLLKNTQ